jgi:glycosyltransferase involved in cell wall biosynthesis
MLHPISGLAFRDHSGAAQQDFNREAGTVGLAAIPQSVPLLSVIIPVYNEQSTVGEVIRRVAGVGLPIPMEIIVVDDGSTDSTPQILSELGSAITRFYASPVNQGKGAAVRLGLTMAAGDIILIQDADLELDPEEYRHLLQPIIEGKAAVVYGSRFLHRGNRMRFSRRLANRFLTGVTNLLYNTRLTDMETAYKVFRSEVMKNIELRATGFEIEPEITARLALSGYRIVEVPVSYSPRTKLEGKKIRWRDGIKALWCLFRNRFSPHKKV